MARLESGGSASIAGCVCSAVSWMRCLSRRHGLIVTPLAAACRARPRTVSPSSPSEGSSIRSSRLPSLRCGEGSLAASPSNSSIAASFSSRITAMKCVMPSSRARSTSCSSSALATPRPCQSSITVTATSAIAGSGERT